MKSISVLIQMGIAILSHAQTRDTVWTYPQSKFKSVFIGYNFKSEHFFELGYLHVKDKGFGHHPFGVVKSLSAEFKASEDWIVGPKVGVSAYGGAAPFVMGVNLIYYFNGQGNGALAFRPEVGIGLYGIKVTYGWNLFFSSYENLKLDPAVISIQIPLRIKLAGSKNSP